MAGLEQHIDDFRDADARVIAISADEEDDARQMVEDENLTYPVVYGVDVDEMHAEAGLYVEKGPRTHLQPAQFILGGNGDVRLASYSSGAVGRLSAEEALERVESLRG